MSADPEISDTVYAAYLSGCANHSGDPSDMTRSGVREAIVAWVLERSTDAPLTGRHAHAYQSTACTHFRHEDCRLTCKFCRTGCLCECHQANGEPDGSTDGEPDVGYGRAIATLLDVAERTGSPAARWAAGYLAADPDRRAATPASAGAPEAPPNQDLQKRTKEDR